MQTITTASGNRIPAAVVLRGAGNMPSSTATALCKRARFEKGDEIFSEGDAAEFFYKVVSGTVRTCKLLSDGRRQIDDFHFSSDFFGLESGGEHRFTAEAIDAVEVEVFRRSQFTSLIHDHPAFGNQLVAAMMTDLDRAHGHMVLLGRKTAQEKIATFLLDMARRLKRSDRFDLPMPRSDIADHLGLTIETVSRTLTQMVRDGLIGLATTGRSVVLTDRVALQQLDG